MDESLRDLISIAEALTNAHNNRQIDKYSEILSPDFVAYITDWPQPLDRDDYIYGAKKALEAFNNLKFTIVDALAQDDKVALRIIASGKHTGDYHGIKPTGQNFEFESFSIRRIKNGKIIEEWQVNDQYNLFKQLGAKYSFS